MVTAGSGKELGSNRMEHALMERMAQAMNDVGAIAYNDVNGSGYYYRIVDVIQAFKIPPDYEEEGYQSIFDDGEDITTPWADDDIEQPVYLIPLCEIKRLAFFGTSQLCHDFRQYLINVHKAVEKTGWYDPERNHEPPIGKELDALEMREHVREAMPEPFKTLFRAEQVTIVHLVSFVRQQSSSEELD